MLETLVMATLATIVILFVLSALKTGTKESRVLDVARDSVLTSIASSNVEKADDVLAKLKERAGEKPVELYLSELGSFQTALHNFGGGAK